MSWKSSMTWSGFSKPLERSNPGAKACSYWSLTAKSGESRQTASPIPGA